jgi:3-deoxy-D-manno-octulosonic-acid transferase
MFFYHFLWTLATLLGLPVAVMFRHNRLAERFTLTLPSARLKEGGFWIHALSVGEVISAIPLVQALRARYPDKSMVFTVTTEKGMTVALQMLGGRGAALLPMPVDAWWCIRRMVRVVRPSVFVLVETDLWPALPRYLRNRGTKSLLVNGRVSPRTLKSYMRFPALARALFQPFECCLMQSELDRDRLLQVGVSPEKVIRAGNLKFDHDRPPLSREERKKWLRLLKLEPGDFLWVAGSTHEGEEKAVLEVFGQLRRSYPHLRLLLAPRKVERAEEVRTIAGNLGLQSILRTDLSKGFGLHDVFVLNTLGELARIYGLARVSFVGGSLVPIGGHNLLEPACFGCPVLFGPHTHNFVRMSEMLVERGGGWRVQDAAELYRAMNVLLRDGETRKAMGKAAEEFVKKNRGALHCVVSWIERCMS